MKPKPTETLNPFNFHCLKDKFSIVGKKPHKCKSRPGQSRAHGIEVREKTLLIEINNKHKSKHGYFKDRRLGESDPSMDLEKKNMLRYVATKKKESKRSMYNLNDNEILTHKGEALNTENMLDVADFSDEEDNDDNNGNIDGDYVDAQHFGGGLFTKTNNDEDKPKTRKEWIDEIIAESKKSKLAAKEEKALYEEAVAEINETYPSFLKRISNHVMTKDEKDLKKKTCAFSAYDKLYHQLNQAEATRANPTDRLKTKEEIEKEQKGKVKVYEAERKKMMRNAFEQQEDKAALKDAGRSMDALEKCFQIEDLEEDDQFAVSNAPNEATDIQKEAKGTERAKKKKKSKLATKSPSDFEIPDKFEDFWELLRGYSPSELSGFITKTIDLNHPTTGKPYEKCCQLFAFLFKVIDKLCQADGESLSSEHPPIAYCGNIINALFQLAHLSPATSANTVKDIIMKKFSLYSKTGYRKFPCTDTFIVLRICSILFPVSDFEHDALTPALVFMQILLSYARVATKRDVLALLFTTNLMFEYCNPTKRFFPEIIYGLESLLYMAVPRSEEKSKMAANPRIAKCAAEQLTFSKVVEKFDETKKLKFSLINDDNENMTRKLKLLVIAETLTLLKKASATFSAVSVAKVVFKDVDTLLGLMPSDRYPPHVQDLLQEAVTSVRKLSGPGLQLAMIRPRVQAITFYEPRIEEITDSKSKKGVLQQDQQRLRLQHKRERKATKREVKKDFQFVANLRLQDTIRRDGERKRKLDTIIRELGSQESEFKKYMMSKGTK